MTQTPAVVFEGQPGQLMLKQIPCPAPRGAEILVQVAGCTLCGSDLHSFEGRRTVPVPTILGHEIVGDIAAFGDEAPRCDLNGAPLQIGDRITWAIVAHCGRCYYCQRGLPQKCQQGVKYGHEAMRPGVELRGGMAGACLLAPGTSILKVPVDLPLEVVCPANCATATVAAALEALGDIAERSFCVFGAGMLGLTACAMLRSRGAEVVVCVDPDEQRQRLAIAFGATQTASSINFDTVPVSASQDDSGSAKSLREALPFGFDGALELSGNSTAIESALPLLRMGGTLVLVGAVFPTAPVSLLPEQIVRRQLTVRGIHNYAPRHLVQAVEFLSAQHQRYPFASLVREWHSLSDIPAVLSQPHRPPAIRIGLRPTR